MIKKPTTKSSKGFLRSVSSKYFDINCSVASPGPISVYPQIYHMLYIVGSEGYFTKRAGSIHVVYAKFILHLNSKLDTVPAEPL